SRLQIIGVYKIDVGAFLYASEQSPVVFQMQGIPSHVRDLESVLIWNPKDLAFQDPESVHSRRLITPLKQKLQPETDPKERSPSVRHLPDHLIKPRSSEIVHRVSKCPYARKDDFIRFQYLFSVPCYDNVLPQQEESLFHALDISGIIIDNRYHVFTSHFLYIV